MNHRITAIAVIPFALGVATAGPAMAAEWQQRPMHQPVDWPDEGSGYPGSADAKPPAVETVNQATALHPTSIALGALGGITLGGAALGITLVVQHRREHVASTQGV
ncbi:hypothetical protein [Kribbella sp. CA-247076]|uniref:hypothetical protein n=1 Tax=Kribbella sp. CA-247076 TaxID=3239941 RepID=UPI003D92F107